MVLNIAIVGLVLQFAALDYMRLGKRFMMRVGMAVGPVRIIPVVSVDLSLLPTWWKFVVVSFVVSL